MLGLKLNHVSKRGHWNRTLWPGSISINDECICGLKATDSYHWTTSISVISSIYRWMAECNLSMKLNWIELKIFSSLNKTNGLGSNFSSDFFCNHNHNFMEKIISLIKFLTTWLIQIFPHVIVWLPWQLEKYNDRFVIQIKAKCNSS